MAFQRIGFQNAGNGNPDDRGVPADVVRFAFWAATSGASGVGQSGDLRVTAAATPSGQVFINRGAAIIASGFTGSQSYAVMNDAAVAVTVPPNTSAAAKTSEVILRVYDAQFAGEPANDGLPQVLLVPSLPSGQTYLHLATITQPANTGVVTQANIVDRRRLVNPRRSRDIRVVTPTTAQPLGTTSAAGEQWPDEALFDVTIPSWATRCNIVATWSGVYCPPGTVRTAMWVEIGWGRADMVHTDFVYMQTDGTSSASRTAAIAPGSVPIPASMRGQAVRVMGKGRLMSGPVASTIRLDAASACAFDMEFVEVPE